MATESFTCLRRNGPKTVIAVKHGLRDRGKFTALACKATKTKIAKLQFAE